MKESTVLSGQHSLGAQEEARQEWYTPKEYIELVRNTLGSIDLDPASCLQANEIVKAAVYYNKDADGLDRAWFGNVFLNPPYDRENLPLFASKFMKEYELKNFDNGIFLMNASTETDVAQRLFDEAIAVCFPKGRIAFLDSQTMQPIRANNKGQMFFLYTKDIDIANAFYREFSTIGSVVFTDKAILMLKQRAKDNG